MFTIKEYNNQLNKSYNANENYIKWNEYRKKLCEMYINYLDNISNCLIVGAGFLNDICISEILNKVKHISLLDIDIEAIEKGLKNHNISNEKTSTIDKDITSLDSDNFFEKIIYMLQSDDINGIKRYFNELASKTISLKLEKKFDCIIISSIYTQVLLPQYTFLLSHLIKKEQFNMYLEPFMYFISKIIRKINISLLENVNKEGIVVCFSDIFEFTTEDNDYKKIRENINDFSYMENYYNNYTKKYGHGLGSYGIDDTISYINLKSSSWHIWPFDKKRILVVKLIIGVKK